MHFIKVLTLCLFCSVGSALAVPTEPIELQTIILESFWDSQKQVIGDSYIYGRLKRANDLFESGVKPEYPDNSNYQETIKQLVDNCHLGFKLSHCPTKEEFARYDELTSYNFPAIGSFLKGCRLNKLEKCTPLMLENIKRDIDGVNPLVQCIQKFMRALLDLNSNYGLRLAGAMLDLDKKATKRAAGRLLGANKAFESVFKRLIEVPCREIVDKIDHRIEFYGLEFYADSHSSANLIVSWNLAFQHCKVILSNKKLVLEDTQKALEILGLKFIISFSDESFRI